MLILKKINAYLGLLLAVIAISVAPMLRVPLKGNWTLYETDSRLFFISFALIAAAAFCLFLKQVRAFRFCAWVMFGWSVLMALAVYLKTNHYFGSRFFDKMLSKTIHYQWGWVVLLVAVILLLSSVKRDELRPSGTGLSGR